MTKKIRKEIEIQGCIEIPSEKTFDDFWNEFISFIEEKGWSFGGGMREIIDGCYINPDGSKGEKVL